MNQATPPLFLVRKPSAAQNFSLWHIGIDAVVLHIALPHPTKAGRYIESLDLHGSRAADILTQLRELQGEA